MSWDSGFEPVDMIIDKRKNFCPTQKLRYINGKMPLRDFPSKVGSSNTSSQIIGEGDSETAALPTTDCLKKSPITYWRLANARDYEGIWDLVEQSDHVLDEIFNLPDIPDLIEKAAFSMVQFNSQNELISFVCFRAFPNIPAVPSFDWFVWMENVYLAENINPRNCYFIHYLVWRSDYYEEFLRLALETVFMEFPFLKTIILIRPPLAIIPELFAEYFIPLLPRDIQKFNWDTNSVQSLLLCSRHSLLERRKIRLAIVEDHDDLMPMIERQTDKLRSLYGDFCMAEIIEYPGTEDRKTLVCEIVGTAVAFMTLNRAIDLELLNTQFDLGVFHGLRKPTDEDKNAEQLEEDLEDGAIIIPDRVTSSFDMINSDLMENLFDWKPVVCFDNTEDKSEDSDERSELSIKDLIQDSVTAKINLKSSVSALETADSLVRQSFESEYGEEHGTIKTELSLVSLQYYNLPEYHGPPNAFCIELFAVHEDFDEKLCGDFLEAAFELFPDIEYCLMTIPSQCPTFPLLDLFVRVTPRPLKRFKQELYVCHKSSVMLTLMRVRPALKSDLKDISNLLRGIDKQEHIYADVANACLFPESAYESFVLVCDRTIVGVSVVCRENGIEYLTENYHVADFIDFDLHRIEHHAILKHLALSPIFQTHARFFLRDIMRMADLTSLYRARYEEEWIQSSLITALGQLVPVKPRRMIKYHEPSLEPNTPPPYLLKYDRPFALYHINTRICSLRKFVCNINLIVVGASRTAYSFLEHLLYAPNSMYVTYNNIIWVSPHGTGSGLAPHCARDLMFPYRGKYNERYKAQINLLTFVNFVYGVMTEINRTEKYIVINSDAILRYDFLVLLCGKQYLTPVPLVQESDVRRCLRSYRPRCFLFRYLVNQKERKFDEKTIASPSNVFLINTPVDATNALISLQYMLRKRKNVETDEKIIIYGMELCAYLCIQSLLKFGIPPEMIVFIEPEPKNNSAENVFMDPNVDAAVANILKELKITHYRYFDLYDWTFCNERQVDTAIFHSRHRRITLKCMAMFPFKERLVADVTFKAVNEASLVYDGGLVINHKFQTNDPFIYAAGSFTKYQRKYYANDKNHELYSSVEVGKLLAEVIRPEVDPTEESVPSATEGLVPNLSRPLLVYGQLPGEWNFLQVRKPGKVVPMEAHCNVKEYGDTLTTGDCTMSNGYGYFCIHLDHFGFVEKITCFTKDEIDIENLPMLCGKHEKYLNDLLMRFDLGLITDFFAYFRQPWVYALYHDRFSHLIDNNMDVFEREIPDAVGKPRIIDMIDDTLNKNPWNKINEVELKNIKESFERSGVKENIVRNTTEYLTAYEEAFPMYATPGVTRVVLHDANSSSLHKPLYRGPSGVYRSSVKISDPGF